MVTGRLVGLTAGRGGVAVLGLLIATTSTFGQTTPPASVDLTSVVRDFRSDHPDMNIMPLFGYGYYAGNVAIDLDAQGKPQFTGQGYKQVKLPVDAFGRPIAPHLVNTCGLLATGGEVVPGMTSSYLTVDERVKLKGHSVIDSFDSNIGPYGGENVGSNALVRVNGAKYRSRYVRLKHKSVINGDVLIGPEHEPQRAVRLDRGSVITGDVANLDAVVEMPEMAPPEGMSESVGRIRYKSLEHTISEDLHCLKLQLREGAIVNIQGNVTIWCDDALLLDDESEIRLMEDSTLTLYVGRKVRLDDRSMLNMNTGNPQLVSINMLGVERRGRRYSWVKLDDESQMAAWVQGARTVLVADDRSEFFGSFVGRKVYVVDESRLHVDMATGEPTGGNEPQEPVACDLGDSPGVAGLASTADITSQSTFFEWWRDVLGVNQSTVHTITLTRQSSTGEYMFFDDDFRPIDGLLLGNQGDVHNYHISVELDASFTYDASLGQFFEFRGTDDTYVFINDKLVIDLGGLGFNKVQTVGLDRLGLQDQATARLRLFHAQRQRGLGIFRIRTNLLLTDNNGGGPSVNSVLED